MAARRTGTCMWLGQNYCCEESFIGPFRRVLSSKREGGKTHLQDIYDSPGRLKSSPGIAAAAVGRRPFKLSDQMFFVAWSSAILAKSRTSYNRHWHLDFIYMPYSDRSVKIYEIFKRSGSFFFIGHPLNESFINDTRLPLSFEWCLQLLNTEKKVISNQACHELSSTAMLSSLV